MAEEKWDPTWRPALLEREKVRERKLIKVILGQWTCARASSKLELHVWKACHVRGTCTYWRVALHVRGSLHYKNGNNTSATYIIYLNLTATLTCNCYCMPVPNKGSSHNDIFVLKWQLLLKWAAHGYHNQTHEQCLSSAPCYCQTVSS